MFGLAEGFFEGLVERLGLGLCSVSEPFQRGLNAPYGAFVASV
jgi:hypothetical protein